MIIRHTLGGTGTLALCIALQSGCGDDAKSADQGDDQNVDAGDMSAPRGRDESAAVEEDVPVALDSKLDADAAAQDLCRMMPWVVGSLTEKQLPASKVTNTVRDDLQTFINDKPPICIDDADSMKDLCIEQPEGAATLAYLYRAANAAVTDPVEQVWCKSDSFADLALIKGAEKAAKGDCAVLQAMVVTWAQAQLPSKSARSVRYEGTQSITGSQWTKALVTTREEGDVLVVVGQELYAPTKAKYIEDNGMVLAILEDNFFGNHYCKVLSPAAVLAWLQGS